MDADFGEKIIEAYYDGDYKWRVAGPLIYDKDNPTGSGINPGLEKYL